MSDTASTRKRVLFAVKIYAELAGNRKKQRIKSLCDNSILTGEYADTSKNGGRKGRQDWWIYIEGGDGGDHGESNHYKTREDAEEMAAYIQKNYGKKAVVTKGRKPNYTLENAFTETMPKMLKALKERLGELK